MGGRTRRPMGTTLGHDSEGVGDQGFERPQLSAARCRLFALVSLGVRGAGCHARHYVGGMLSSVAALLGAGSLLGRPFSAGC